MLPILDYVEFEVVMSPRRGPCAAWEPGMGFWCPDVSDRV